MFLNSETNIREYHDKTINYYNQSTKTAIRKLLPHSPYKLGTSVLKINLQPISVNAYKLIDNR